mmetsp:Transcript_24494/g.37986  ORF Transcript_24494/g.37986 Transcript_24494/m.37986 type:complete len:85 (-) Transcript_24494:21-275(-)
MGKSQDEKEAKPSQSQQAQNNNILIGESGDILARYRIPIDGNEVDFELRLPTDSDSSVFSSEKDGGGDIVEMPKPQEELKDQKK